MNTLKKQMSISQSALLNKKGSVIGSILLICGSSIGVGILPLPILTGQAGAVPTLMMFTLCWLFMSTTALLILESSVLLSGKKNFISLSKETLNKTGQVAVFLSFIYLFYSLTTAYLAKGGELVLALCQNHMALSVPEWSGAAFLAVISMALIFLGPFIVDHVNRIFMVGFFATYLFLIFSGNEYFHVQNINHSDWGFSLFIIPFIVTSFGYHNMIPSVGEYLGNDKRKLFLAIFISGVVLFLIYNFWIIILHGIIPLQGDVSIINSFAKGEIVTEPLSKLIHSPLIQVSAQYMAFFAIVTSILGQGLSIIDFLADTLGIKKTVIVRLGLCLALFFPTFLFSQLIPGVFFKALELAGGIAAMVIFGIIPALMSWVVRYRRDDLKGQFQQLVPGGKPMLVMIMAAASFIIGYELLKNFT